MSDLIDRQAAISAICNACGKIDCDKMDKCDKLQLPPANNSEFPNSSDTISRANAIEALYSQREKSGNIWVKTAITNCVEAIEQLPPAQLERIIHCKDCEWWTKQEGSSQGRCALSGMYPSGGWFCGNARMREVTK